MFFSCFPFFFNLFYVAVNYIFHQKKLENEYGNIAVLVVTIVCCLLGSVLLVFYRVVNYFFCGLKRFQFLKRLGSKVLILAVSSEIFNIVLNFKILELYVTTILTMGVLVADGALFHPERDSGVADAAFLGSLRLLSPHLLSFILGIFSKEKKMGILKRLYVSLFQYKTPITYYSGAALASYVATLVCSSIAMAQLPDLEKITTTLNDVASKFNLLPNLRQPPPSTKVLLSRRGVNERRSKERRPIDSDDPRTPPPLGGAFFSCDFDYPFSRQQRLSETPRVQNRPCFRVNSQFWENRPQRKTRKALFLPSSDEKVGEIVELFEKTNPKKMSEVKQEEPEKSKKEKEKSKKKKKMFSFFSCH